jgi:hypothetical protein
MRVMCLSVTMELEFSIHLQPYLCKASGRSTRDDRRHPVGLNPPVRTHVHPGRKGGSIRDDRRHPVGLNPPPPPPRKLTRRHPLNLTAQEVGRFAGQFA